MEWKPILEADLGDRFSAKLDDIITGATHKEWPMYAPGLMTGNAGTALFLFLAGDRKDDEAILEQAVRALAQSSRSIRMQLDQPSFPDRSDVSFDSGLAGIGWTMGYLLKNDFIDGTLDELYGATDAAIFRNMITYVQESALKNLPHAVGIGIYAVNRDSRLAQEYLRRFIRELYARIQEPSTTRKILAMPDEIIAGMIRLLEKIRTKYPDIADTTNVVRWVYGLFENYPKSASELHLQTLFALQDDEASRRWASEELTRRAKWTTNHADMLKVDAGLERGLTHTAHCFNRIYQRTDDPLYRDAAIACFDILLDRAIHEEDGVALWNTSSKGLWCRHLGLLNGISGIGLALLAAVTEEEPRWDECIYLS